MKRASLAILFAGSVASFSATLPTRPAWIFVALAIVAALRTPRSSGLALAGAAERLVRLSLVATLLFGWFVMVYPVLDAADMRLYSLLLGYPLAALGAFFLWFDARPPWATTIPAAAGLLVLSSFDLESAVHPYLWIAGAAGLVYLMLETPAEGGRRKLGRAALFGAFGIACAGAGIGIVLLLPWAQDRVEDVMMDFFTPLESGGARNRSRLGELRELKLSKKVVLRVWSERPQRLRGQVLFRFDGGSWYRDNPTLEVVEGAVDRTGIEAGALSFLASLPGSDYVPKPDKLEGQRLIQTKVVLADRDATGLATPGGSRLVRAPLSSALFDPAGLVVAPPVSDVGVYGVLHEVNHQQAWDEVASPETIAASLQLPENLDPRIPELSLELTGGATDRMELVERVVRALREDYAYSLDIGDIDPKDPLADFLFRSKKGWCEYFAGSAVMLLRSQGVPTRYVQGWNVVGSQKKGNHYVVREWDRHAWIEVYFDELGWLEYDPTPAAEYESLHAGLSEAFWSDALEALLAQVASLRQRDWSAHSGVILGALALLLALYAAARLAPALWRWSRARRGIEHRMSSAIEELARELDRTLERLGHPRPRSRAPLEHLTSLSDETIPPELRLVASRILTSYYRTRFGGETTPEAEVTELKKALAAVR